MFDFECICGEVLHTKEIVFAHNTLHSIKPHAVIEVVDLVDSQDAVGDVCLDEMGAFGELASSLDEGAVVGEPHEIAMDIDDSVNEVDVMFHLSDLIGDEESDEESSDSDIDASFEITSGAANGVAVDLSRLNNCPEHTMNLLNLYRFCIERNITVKGYRQLRDLPMFEPYHDIPLNLKHLRRKVENYIETAFNWPRKRVVSIAGNHIPYMSVDDCMAVWLAVPSIVRAVQDWGRKYLPSNLVDVDAYVNLIVDRHARVSRDTYSYDTVADGSFYLVNIRDAIPLFKEEYLRALDDEIEVLVCTVGLYEDNFGKNLNSLVSQTLFCMTLRKGIYAIHMPIDNVYSMV